MNIDTRIKNFEFDNVITLDDEARADLKLLIKEVLEYVKPPDAKGMGIASQHFGRKYMEAKQKELGL